MMNYLYTFRRCPYAMRARIGLHLSKLNPDVREIELKNKPAEMVAISAKATVPVLAYQQQIIAESIDIFKFAITQYPLETCPYLDNTQYQLVIQSICSEEQQAFVNQNDNQFKPWLDKYKYADRHPQMSQSAYRHNAEEFVQQLEDKLTQQTFLFAHSPTFADYAIFPFIRQFAAVEPKWFESCGYIKVQQWLALLISNDLFKQVMIKYPLWLDEKKQYH
ncbi:glutathione S-transferase [Shewanella sp. OMA3-2]|uniref:glutathione S-transferase n=1 Tax=Shewanella sp. OMA3-2 TaxID=2908650 RepID=UPI001F4116C0|nr:glutathione S-transferase [Shewanella sp. OMA3-2]UJF23345.1 glutathione S-transferase [Shewanella sp. OMA3-2]